MLETLREVLKMTEEAGATRYWQTPSFGTVANGTDSTPQPVRFTRDGFVTSFMGSLASGAVADYGGSSLRVQLGGTEDLFVDGQGGPAFFPFLGLFGGVQNARKCVRRVKSGDLWIFTVRNATGGNIVPTVDVAFLDDEDVAAMLRELERLRGARR